MKLHKSTLNVKFMYLAALLKIMLAFLAENKYILPSIRSILMTYISSMFAYIMYANSTYVCMIHMYSMY